MKQRIAAGLGVVFLLSAGFAVAQNTATGGAIPTTGAPVTVPDGYTLHQSIDIGGRVTNNVGSGAMYNTLVNLQSGPRVQGETFELRALPGKKGGILDHLKAFSNGFGGDPNNLAKLEFGKGKLYDFSGMFRRDRQYFDYNLLGNPNIPNQSIAIGPTATPTGSMPWQAGQSPFLFNTVRRMTDTSLTLLPLSKFTFRVSYSQNIFQGPSLTPSGYYFGGSSTVVLQEMQRNSTDDFIGAVDWKPLPNTRLTYEQQVNHYKGDSYFTLAPNYMNVQEPNGQKVALLVAYDSLTAPTTASLCNASSAGTTPLLTAPQTPGGLPVVNSACAVTSSYQRIQPTRVLFPTEILRMQSSSIKNISMNGNVRYTQANMNMPSYYDSFQGLTKASTATAGASRAITYTGNAKAKRATIAADYGVVWRVAKNFNVAEQINYSNVQQPGSAILTSGSTVATTGAPNQTVNTQTLTTTATAAGTSPLAGSPSIGGRAFAFFGQKFVTNNLTASWDVTPRATVSLTYRYELHKIGFSTAGSVVEDPGDVTIHENGGILNVALRPASNWSINGTVELLYHDNAFTPVSPRETQHYKFRTSFKPKPWATISGAFNDIERHNNTNNTGSTPLFGPLKHEDHSRTTSVGAILSPNERYGFEVNYAYSDVYTSTNTCYTGIQTAGFAAAAPVNGKACYNASSPSTGLLRGSTTQYEFGPVKDFMDAPTQDATVVFRTSPVKRLQSNFGYNISSVNGSRFFPNPRDVNGSLVSTYQSPFVNVAWTVHKGLIWSGQYNYYGYGEGGRSGAQYCSSANPTATGAAVVPCSTLPNTAMNGPVYGFTTPRNFHANNVTLGVHYEF